MRYAILFLFASIMHGAVVLDRIAVVVGKHAIKTSDIDRDLRITAFLNRQPLDVTSQSKRQSAERLIDQEIIREEIVTGDYRRPADSDAMAFEKQLVHDRFGGSSAHFDEALAHYGLTEVELRPQLLWQLTVLRFIDQRFRAGVFVSDEDVRAYYDQHRDQLQKQHPKDASFETLKEKIRTSLEGEQVNQNFNAWLEESRKRYRIEYKLEAFG